MNIKPAAAEDIAKIGVNLITAGAVVGVVNYGENKGAFNALLGVGIGFVLLIMAWSAKQ